MKAPPVYPHRRAKVRLRAFVTVDGISTYYEQVGAGPDVVLVHGLGYNCTCWNDQIAALYTCSRVTAYDLPGFGKSGPPPHGFNFDFYINHLSGLMQALGITPTVLGGHSMGGSILLQWVGTLPSGVKAFVVADTELPDPSEHAAAERLTKVIEKYGLAVTLPYFQNTFYSINFQASNRVAILAWQRQFMTNSPENLVTALMAWVGRQNPQPLLANVSCPCLVLVGVEDNFATVSKAQLVQAAIPSAQLLLIGNSGHLTLQEQPASVSAALTQALAMAG